MTVELDSFTEGFVAKVASSMSPPDQACAFALASMSEDERREWLNGDEAELAEFNMAYPLLSEDMAALLGMLVLPKLSQDELDDLPENVVDRLTPDLPEEVWEDIRLAAESESA